MKLAVITDSSAYLEEKTLQRENLYILDIPVNIDGEEYVEGVNLTAEEFYQKMAQSAELPKTSQPSIAKLDEILPPRFAPSLSTCVFPPARPAWWSI